MVKPLVSVKPLIVPAPGRDGDLLVRVSAPVVGAGLPILLFAHGFGSSLHGYGPLADHWASEGFVVVQPTFPDSRTVGVGPGDPGWAGVWRTRVADLVRVLDAWDGLESAVPGLAGRVDPTLVAVAGHSFGGQSAGSLLGLRVLDRVTGEGEDLSDPRVRTGVLLATAGRGSDMTPEAVQMLPFINPDFSGMTRPALIVAGDHDDSPLSGRGPDWMTDPYYLSPGPKSLLTVFGGEHSLGGIPGYEAAETTDENQARVAMIQQVTTDYLRAGLGLATSGVAVPPELGRLESR
ncbi:chlorophyllase [Kineosporia sp. NBRC 101731]|uniref:alpha/beta hydrolase family protein n=1 Tax=Kineosporia sp. NBRC 101731 TaxID=3032199 RepID=UPI003316A5AA